MIWIDGDNCGDCNVDCSVQEYCATGTCTPCPAGFEDCDGDGSNGCEVDTANDANNCGGGGTVCGTTLGGLCCSGSCLDSDFNNCGACGQQCFEGMLVINELMHNPDQVGDSEGEWFELYNPNPFDVDVRGFLFEDLGADDHTVESLTPVIIPSGGYAALGNNSNLLQNGGANVIYQYSGIALANSADELLVVAHGQELDRVVWDNGFPEVGISKELSDNHQTYLLNDTLTNWCDAMTPYGLGDLGTPGTANDCTLPP